MKEIALTRGLVALVDDDDFDVLSQFNWYADSNGYACRKISHPTKPGKQQMVRMHRVILGLASDDPRRGDHRDGNKANNQRLNLRICTNDENIRNRKRHSNNRSGYKGVAWNKTDRHWVANIAVNGRQTTIGRYATPEAAYTAYCEAADKLHGDFSNHG